MKKTHFLLALLFSHAMFGTVKKPDSLRDWLRDFYTIGNLQYSENGKWVAVKKWHHQNNDTIMVFDATKDYSKVGYLLKKPFLAFTKNNYALAYGNNKAVWWNLLTSERIDFDNVNKAFTFDSGKQFFIWTKDAILNTYTEKGIFLSSFSAVKKVVSNLNNELFLCRKIEDHWQIEKTGIKESKIILTSTEEITDIKLVGTLGKYLAVTSIDHKNQKTLLTIIDATTGTVVYSKEVGGKHTVVVNLLEVGKDSSVFIDFQQIVQTETLPLLDIWYGNDNDLQSKKNGKLVHRYWLFDLRTGVEKTLENKRFSEIIPLPNSRFFLTFNPLEENDYLFHRPLLTVHLYDPLLTKNTPVFTHVSELVTDQSGTYLLAFDEPLKKWVLFNIKTHQKVQIKQNDLKNPVFSSDGIWVFFESNHGLIKYGLLKGSLMKDFGSGKNEVSIVNTARDDLSHHFKIVTSSLDSANPLLLKLGNKNDHSTSYILRVKNIVKEIIPFTKDRIKELKYDKNLLHFAFIRENYTLSPQLQIFNRKESKVYHAYEVLQKEVPPQQKIFNYKNSQGVVLKGVLYFPSNFNPLKKYPLVVHIYQIQSASSNKFQIAAVDDPVAFNIPLLQKNGYFVFLPDIIHDKRGTGLSALDCINSGLAAIASIANIDLLKIGLTGHSHGGYETNFIATHSTRFAAYISGSGHSDIVRAYFSYSDHYETPFYWQFENQQYEMNQPFSLDKARYILNNPIMNVEKVNAPVLLWTGKKDESVHWGHTMEFYIGLKRNNKNVIALFYTDQEHDMGKGTPESLDLNRRALDWWNYFLKSQKNIHWIDHQMKKDAF